MQKLCTNFATVPQHCSMRQCNATMYVVSKLCNNMSFFATRVGCGSVWQLACSVVCDRICVEVLGGWGWTELCLYVLSCVPVSFHSSIESHWSILGFRPHCSQLHCVNSALYWWLKHNSIFPNRIVLFHDSHPAIPQRLPTNCCTKNLFIISRNTLGLVLSQLWI